MACVKDTFVVNEWIESATFKGERKAKAMNKCLRLAVVCFFEGLVHRMTKFWFVSKALEKSFRKCTNSNCRKFKVLSNWLTMLIRNLVISYFYCSCLVFILIVLCLGTHSISFALIYWNISGVLYQSEPKTFNLP